jgi:16S rRNA C967 or C1407 C5-methylase (RsmB/RsmF family)/NOL1/NOP2/fmu family ribosome biogenesis protein
MFPREFISRTRALLPYEYDALSAALEAASPPVSIRLNPYKAAAAGGLPGFRTGAGGSPEAGQVPWCTTGYYLPERPSFTFDPLFHAGAYYVQEASSMFLEQVIGAITAAGGGGDKITALDLCAAPGGKFTHLSALLPGGSLLVGNEVVRSRCLTAAENMTRWGVARQMITNNDPKDFGRLKHAFDIILADLPCSGEGMFRKDRAARGEWSVGHVRLCASRQRRIIRDVWDALRPGGWLIYGTCTFNTEENEENVCRLSAELGAEVVPVPVKPEWNIAGALQHDIPAYRFFPHRTRGEGLFLALMRKNGDPADGGGMKIKDRDCRQPVTVPAEVKGMLSGPERFVFLTRERLPRGNVAGAFAAKPEKTVPAGRMKENRPAAGPVFALPEDCEERYRFFSRHLRVISAGITAGEYKGRDFIPSVSLALSTEMNRGAFPAVDLPYDAAITYLRKEAVPLPEDTPKGYVLLTYRHVPLGFVKNIGSRANNLYPAEWRIGRPKVR